MNTQVNDPKGEAGNKKAPMHLLPPYALEQCSWVHKLGASKYGAYNWRDTGVCATTYVSAIMRHLNAWRDGEDLDPESGISHIAHIAASCNILLDAQHCDKLQDDRNKKPVQVAAPKSTTDKPDGLPPYPPVPTGYDRWVYRGKGWRTERRVLFAAYSEQELYWDVCHSFPAGFGHTHYIEAVKD